MPLWVPSMMAHFTLKFDESLDLQPDYGTNTVDKLVKTGGARALGTPSESSKPKLVTKGRESYVLNRVPLDASVELPGFRQAGSFSLSMDFSELPIDPRTVRAAAIEIHVGTVDAESFARGIRMGWSQANRSRESVLDTRGSGLGSTSETLALTAIVDKWRVEHKGESSLIKMMGRDLRGILLDTPLPSNPEEKSTLIDQLDLNQPIDELVAQILRYHPNAANANFQVAISPSEWGPKGPPRVGTSSIIPRHKRGAKGRKSQVHTNSDTIKMSFWDLIVQFCYYVGAIPLLKGTEIVIRPVKRLYDQQNAGIDPGVSTPFLNGNVREVDKQSGKPISPLRLRRLVYGRDIQDLEIERNFAGYQRPRVVRCISHDSSSTERGDGKPLVSWWPPVSDKKPRKTSKTPGQEAAHEEILTIPVSGVRDVKVLEEIAHAIYDEIGRGEIGGSASTKNLSSFGGDNADPDLLRLRPGDPVELGVDTRSLRPAMPLVSTYTDHIRESFEKRVEQITQILGDEDLARVIVATSRGQIQQVQRFFRVSHVKYSWDAKSGIKVDFDFQNYIEARHKSDDTRPPSNSTLKRTVV